MSSTEILAAPFSFSKPSNLVAMHSMFVCNQTDEAEVFLAIYLYFMFDIFFSKMLNALGVSNYYKIRSEITFKFV